MLGTSIALGMRFHFEKFKNLNPQFYLPLSISNKIYQLSEIPFQQDLFIQ